MIYDPTEHPLLETLCPNVLEKILRDISGIPWPEGFTQAKKI